MNYRLTVLTPLLVGDGQKLSPIDYMVWRDQVNVLDQRRIFRLLSRGPRLEGYLSQLQKAEKLDFASWGGFAQNYAGRRIPFEHSSMTAHWQSARAEHLHIPTFASNLNGPFLPASALKGALRTGFASGRFSAGVLRELASRAEGDRPIRRPGETAEAMTLGPAASDPMRQIMAGDSRPARPDSFKVYLLRVATLDQRGGSHELGWKQAARANAPGRAPDQGTPAFVEMAIPGTYFEGDWRIREFLRQPEIVKGLHRRENAGVDKIFSAANDHAAGLLAAQLKYAETASLSRVAGNLQALSARLSEVRERSQACLLNLGWGGGLLSKTAFLETDNEDYRNVLRRTPFYERAIRSAMPFPKTRRIVFEQNQPSTMAGWALLELV